ncbi:unnamed protein product [Haemonchus placei]|uniref:MFS domain-containing protein n=1 Tax=Haemonchus placei TaxID=6290 RepID=A0A0N4WV03_HAEPC|nr:unnamed protein product [Haemonchus placei]
MPREEIKSETTGGTGEESYDIEDDVGPSRSYGTALNAFDGNHPRYKCCCGHMHAMTGVQIIVALLSITVFFDMWQVIGGAAANTEFDRYDMASVCIRFAIGAGITGTVLVSLLTERPVLLIPYLLLQGAGLAAGMVFFVAFLYISLFGDRSTAISFLRSNGHPIDSPDDARLSGDKRAFAKGIEELEVPARPLASTLRSSRSAETLEGPKRKKAAGRAASVNLDYV